MKTEKYYLILAVVTGILSVPALGTVELPQTDERGLIDRINPVLVGIKRLYVVIVPPDSEPNKDGLVFKELEAKVEQKLIEAGLKVAPVTGRPVKSLGIPELKIRIYVLKLNRSQQYVYSVQTSLATKVYVTKKNTKLALKADVWKMGTTIGAGAIGDMAGTVTNLVIEQVETFIYACRVSNPKGFRTPDVNNTELRIAQRRSARQLGSQAVAEYKYIASKNSKVFHNPQCRWAQRILPKNLVGYDSRDEVIQIGKRPCKQCKP